MDERTAAGLMKMLGGLHAVGTARIGADGSVREASGFLAGILPGGPAAAHFRSPTWPRLIAAKPVEGQPLYRGSVTLIGNGGDHCVEAALWPLDKGFFLVAERHDGDVEAVSKSTVKLSNDLATAKRELEQARKDLRERDEKARAAAFVDVTTGLGNRRAFNQALSNEIHRVERYGGPLCILLGAIDNLDGFTAHAGEDRANDVLRAFAQAIYNETRQTDTASHCGRNRFIVMLTQTGPERATHVIDRVRTAFRAASPGIAGTLLTTSFGYVEWRQGDDAGRIVDRAEEALLACIYAGGDRIAAA